MPEVRAKFLCRNKTEDHNGAVITMEPVYDGSEENERFFEYTPAGYIELQTVNPEAATRFEAGKEYYVDFTLAE